MSYNFENGYKIRNQEGFFFLTFTIVGWIDIFSRKNCRDIIIKNLKYCREHKSLLVGAYVIMTNHIHIICQSQTGKLSDTVRDFKSFSTKEIIKYIEENAESRKEWLLYLSKFYANKTNQNKEYKLWTNDNHPEKIISADFLKQRVNYIHENPVRAGWVNEPQYYVYSSASNYILGEGIMDIDFLY